VDNLHRDALTGSELLEHPNFTFHEADVLDSGAVAALMPGATHVVHCAAIAGVETVIESPVRTMRVNVIGTYNVLEAALNSGGSQIRAWCFVDDMVDALLACLERPEAVGQTFNVGNARSVVTILDLAERIKRLSGCPGEILFRPIHYSDVEVRIPNVSKARELLGFEAKVDLDEGLSRTIAWYRERQPATM